MKKNKLQRPLNVGVVGATGMVGKSFMETLAQREFPVGELRPFASEASLGKSVSLQGRSFAVQTLKPDCFKGLDLVFFSSGDDISLDWAPMAVRQGAYAIDNSNAFRMSKDVLLVVPEVNGDLLDSMSGPQVIANPNCTTIQLVVALKPLQDAFGLESVRLSSYQAASGAGQPGYDELMGGTEATINWVKSNGTARLEAKSSTFPHSLAFNCIPQVGSFNDQGYCTEEVKVMNETQKILRQSLPVSVFVVRVPVLNAHAESVWVTLQKTVSREQIKEVLQKFDGIVVQDDPKKSEYPLQSKASGQDPVFVGRIHQDLNDPRTWLMWVVADNVRKGAALNGLQIAERIFDIK